MKIKKLPAETMSKFQSGMIVTDAVQSVLELVHNSLDAEATGIVVRIDLKSYRIRVIDNGKGIAKDDLEFVGERFMTSKYQSDFSTEASFPTYGFKGQALSSLLEVSRSLVIETKSENEGPTFKKVFENNTALPITESYVEKQGTGTTVTVEDFMYAMPVRRKRICEVFDLEEIKNQLQYLAIIHYNVCFTLRNENKGIILIQTFQASSMLESLTNIYGKGLTKCLKALNYKEKKYQVTGFLSLKPQSQSNVQLLYLNKRVITKGVIHKFINNLTKQYSRKQTLLSSSPFGQIMKSLKGSYSAFILQIQCPHSYYELFTNLRKTTVEFRNWKDLLKCIHKAVKRTFKNFINSDSLSSPHHHFEDFKGLKHKEDKKTFGTSLLLNAIKGAPAKRSLFIKREVKKSKKMKINENTQNVEDSFLKPNDKPIDKSLVDSVYAVQQKDSSNDSLESPIPKKNLKSKTFCDSKHKKPESTEESFREFYEWLKVRLETNPSALNFYNDFLQLKNGRGGAEEVAEFKSPVLGGKPKARKVEKSKKRGLIENEKKLSNSFPAIDEEIAIMTKKQLKIYPNVQLRMQKAVQYSKLKNNIPGNVNLSRFKGYNLNFKEGNNQSVFEKSESLIASIKNWPGVDGCTSLPSSEMQFTNIIKFRNLSENFFQSKPSEAKFKIPVEKTYRCSALNSWDSHYQNFFSNSFEFFGENQGTKNYFYLPETEEREIPKRKNNLDLDHYNVFEFKNEAKAGQTLRNVEIQVDMSVIPVKKVDAMVQTYNEVPESPDFENSYIFNQASYTASKNKSDCDFRVINKCLESNFSQEVPNPDFWNTTAQFLDFEKNIAEITTNINDITKNVTCDVLNGKNSTSREFICGQKSHSFIKLQNERSTTKETQTLAGISTDSLIELEYVSEKLNHNNDVNLASTNSENPEVPKTIPAAEIENRISQLSQSNFCLTERHEFVPKGLSPKFLCPETTKTFTLRPLEKWKLKLTIDDTQNESLANVKWQDNSTDDCLKPGIPDRILSEMRQKAVENGMNYENPILSASMSYCAVKVHNLLHSFAFTKELLSGVEILGQLDKKFIITKIRIPAPQKMELISLFDQHAVDERIKLEELINKNQSADGKLVSSSLNPPVECFLKKSDVRIVSDFQSKMLNFGLSAKPVNENTICVNEIPSFLLNKHEKDLRNKKDTSLFEVIKTLVANIISEITELRGAVSKIPKIIYNAFCLEACHKAIKFNKALTAEDMSEMIQKLQNCKLPFQCAHGRPSVIPLIDLEAFNPSLEENETIDFQELKKFSNERKHDIIAVDKP